MEYTSNLKGSGTIIVLEGSPDLLINQSLRFQFKTSNNQAEYETLIVGMIFAHEMSVPSLKAISSSQFVDNQLTREYKMK